MLATALGMGAIGAGTGLAGEEISDYMDDGKIDNSDQSYLGTAAGGFVTGALIPVGGTEAVGLKGIATQMAKNGLAQMAGNTVQQQISTEKVDEREVFETGAFAAVTTGVAYGIGADSNIPKINKLSMGSGNVINYFDEVQFKTEPNKAYFWSGLGETGAETAANIAKDNSGVTLETTIEGQRIKMPEFDINNPNAVEAWQKASAAYAKQASGEVRAIVTSNLRPTSIWNTVELPALKANPNVTKIILTDPKTLFETIIFTR